VPLPNNRSGADDDLDFSHVYGTGPRVTEGWDKRFHGSCNTCLTGLHGDTAEELADLRRQHSQHYNCAECLAWLNSTDEESLIRLVAKHRHGTAGR